MLGLELTLGTGSGLDVGFPLARSEVRTAEEQKAWRKRLVPQHSPPLSWQSPASWACSGISLLSWASPCPPLSLYTVWASLGLSGPGWAWHGGTGSVPRWQETDGCPGVSGGG